MPVVSVVDALSRFASTYAALPTLGLPITNPHNSTVGKRATLWIADLLMDVRPRTLQRTCDLEA